MATAVGDSTGAEPETDADKAESDDPSAGGCSDQ
jgi:hypothetical protein